MHRSAATESDHGQKKREELGVAVDQISENKRGASSVWVETGIRQLGTKVSSLLFFSSQTTSLMMSAAKN
jgi:hypothetical protein